MKKRATGWKRWFTIDVRKLGGPDDDCFSADLRLIPDLDPDWKVGYIYGTTRTTEEDGRRAVMEVR